MSAFDTIEIMFVKFHISFLSFILHIYYIIFFIKNQLRFFIYLFSLMDFKRSFAEILFFSFAVEFITMSDCHTLFKVCVISYNSPIFCNSCLLVVIFQETISQATLKTVMDISLIKAHKSVDFSFYNLFFQRTNAMPHHAV